MRPYRRVNYLHHTRDKDGDVLLFFTDPAATDPQAILQSSPITGLRKIPNAVIDTTGRGNLCRFLVVTAHTDYEITIAREKADHLSLEVGVEAIR